ncbi:mucoidy inhibitor MuiA family protein [Cytophagaceae bacterium DM2B3-1]|uniref:Mucoidy inhibitor MuiA family protein n=1 Tax=Xanthocytophaga flava TaxID=3048013 RepID=A0ABT7CI11_9BACT|nr:mucoidy inhibitor MuiA family protein [Xanthocytophaga flavus]MDJ1493365.1 mucoidy inhibitor MuiA family protein [Xanthocytophaga flavus]
MRITLFLLSVIVSITHLKGANDPKSVSSKIEEVTVFLEGAQITRSASVTLSNGVTNLIFKEIPVNINVQSIQVRGEGNFTVLSVSHSLNYFDQQQKRKEVTELEDQQKNIGAQIEIENNTLAVYQNEEILLLENKKLGSEQQAIKMTDLKEAADFFRSRLLEIKKKQWEVTQSIRKLQEQQTRINAQLTALKTSKDQPSSEIMVTVSSKVAIIGRLLLSYLVNDAGWLPSYDVRVKDISHPVSITYKANVFQNTGEEWKNVKLTISTGNPSQNGAKPTLNPWYLGYNQPSVRQVTSVSGHITDLDGAALPGVNVIVKGTTIGTTTNASGYYTILIPSGATALSASFIGYETQELAIRDAMMNITMTPDIAALNEVVVTGYGTDKVSKSLAGKAAGITSDSQKKNKAQITPIVATQQAKQTNVEFKIDIPYTIPADGKQYAVDMQEYSAPAYYEYYCAPKLDNDVFLTARITDWEEYNLLEGEANLFFEGMFLGKSLLDVHNTNDTLTLSLGRDKNITVTRIKGKDFSSKQLLGSNNKDTRTWEITIRNKKPQSVNLVIEDQFPVPTTKEVEVVHTETKGAEVEESTGKIRWKFALASAQSKKLEVKYEVKYPKTQRIVLE